MQIPPGHPQRGTDTPKHTPVLGTVTLSLRVKSPWQGGVLSLCFPGYPSSLSLLVSGGIQVGQEQSLSLPSSLSPTLGISKDHNPLSSQTIGSMETMGTGHVAAQALYEVFACLTRKAPFRRCWLPGLALKPLGEVTPFLCTASPSCVAAAVNSFFLVSSSFRSAPLCLSTGCLCFPACLWWQ